MPVCSRSCGACRATPSCLPTSAGFAYDDRPLPIGYGQTISEPYIVALMTDLLRLPPHARVLEIGTGSGYQAAVLAELGHQVYTIEIVPALAEQAAKRLSELGYAAVDVRRSDGYYGWPEAAPFDGIVVTAAATQIPAPCSSSSSQAGPCPAAWAVADRSRRPFRRRASIARRPSIRPCASIS